MRESPHLGRGRSVSGPCRLRLRGGRKAKGGQREGDWKEVSSRGGLVSKEPEFGRGLVGGSAGVTGQVSHTQGSCYTARKAQLYGSQNPCLNHDQTGVNEDTAGVPSASQSSHCEKNCVTKEISVFFGKDRTSDLASF